MADSRHPAVVSIHDVMPRTLDSVEELLALCDRYAVRRPALLVVPGLDWEDAELERLMVWEQAGCELIAHGWVHETRPRRLYHRLHAALISRNVAEHLDLDAADIIELMRRSHAWFSEHGLRPPTTYVPPAWALGLDSKRVSDTPFDCIETLGGLLTPRDAIRRHPMPLLGFEADTPVRSWFLRRWNRHQEGLARRKGEVLRISIHPKDHKLYLRGDLERTLNRPWRFMSYAELYRSYAPQPTV